MKPLIISLIIGLNINISFAESDLCRSFENQLTAQHYFEARKPYWRYLDRDLDGEACECLIGGSEYNNQYCLEWRNMH